MWQLKKKFKDPFRERFSSTVVLNSDKSGTSNTNSYPVVWTGWVATKMIKIIQTNSSFKYESFVFEVFPDEYAFLKNKITRWIRDYLNSLKSAEND